MGNIPASFTDTIALLREELRHMRIEMGLFQNRLAGLEKDVSSCGLAINACHVTTQDNSNALLSLHLLEEGRSAYRRPKRHTASAYK